METFLSLKLSSSSEMCIKGYIVLREKTCRKSFRINIEFNKFSHTHTQIPHADEHTHIHIRGNQQTFKLRKREQVMTNVRAHTHTHVHTCTQVLFLKCSLFTSDPGWKSGFAVTVTSVSCFLIIFDSFLLNEVLTSTKISAPCFS